MLSQREQRALYERLIETAGKDIADAFLDAVQRVGNAVNIAQLADAIERGDLRELEMLLRFDQGALFPLTEAMRSAYVEGGLAAARMVGGAFAFNGRHLRAEAFMRAQGGDLVTRIDNEQREMLRSVMDQRLVSGEGGAETARRIVGRVNRATGQREGGFIGLTAQQTQWAQSAERELQNLDTAYFTRERRDRRYDKLVRKAIADGKPLAKADIDRIAGRYRARLLQQRGEVIARTEAHKATSAGQWEAFEQLSDSGQMVTKKWIHGFSREPRLDHVALGLAPPRRFNDPFVMGDGTLLRFPHDPNAPADHVIGCKCSVFYRLVR
jgi:hypothetical protein